MSIIKLFCPSDKTENHWLLKPLGCNVCVEENRASILFDHHQRILSSAYFNGGDVASQCFVNQRVPKDICVGKGGASAAHFFGELQSSHNFSGTFVGMLTAASMRSFRLVLTQVEGAYLCVALTAGLDNARRAGDEAEFRALYSGSENTMEKLGTINIFVATSIPLSSAALVEAHSLIAEAKCTVMDEYGVLSPNSNLTATGTGTDATAVACVIDPNKENVVFTGKHTLLGEQLARSVQTALRSSLDYYQHHR